jgi:cytidylate kinase
VTVIIISSDSYARGRQVAADTAKALGYLCLDREILKAVGARYGVSEVKLCKALDERPSLLGVSSRTQSLYLAYIEEAVLAKLSQGKVVCHGLAAHLYVMGVSHVLKVHILSDPQELIDKVIQEKNVSREKAIKILKREEWHRKRWSLDTYLWDEALPSLYDFVISLSRISPDEAVRMIAETASYRKFKPMTYSVKCMRDKALASRVRSALLGHFPDATVEADGSAVVVKTAAVAREKGKKVKAIEKTARSIPGVGHVEVRVIEDIIREAAESFR